MIITVLFKCFTTNLFAFFDASAGEYSDPGVPLVLRVSEEPKGYGVRFAAMVHKARHVPILTSINTEHLFSSAVAVAELEQVDIPVLSFVGFLVPNDFSLQKEMTISRLL